MGLDAWVLHPDRGIAGVMLCSSPRTWVTTSPGCSCRGGEWFILHAKRGRGGTLESSIFPSHVSHGVASVAKRGPRSGGVSGVGAADPVGFGVCE